MNKYLSLKIKAVSFICIIMVVFLHCYNFADNFLQPTTIITEGLNYGTFIEYFICNGFTRAAVPLFFMISGYLFYLTFKLSVSGYFYKFKRRVLSLAVPYILWTLISMLACLIFWSMDIMPVNDIKTNMDAGGMVQAFLNPPNFQFWFVKQLFLFTVISPFFYLILKFRVTRVIYLFGLFAIWFLNIDIGPVLSMFFVVEALFFFSLGACLSIADKEKLIMKKISKNIIMVGLAAWVVLLSIKTVMCGIMAEGDADTVILILYKVSELIGIFTLWFGMDYIIQNENINNKILNLSKHTFFIFCFHEPLLDFVIQYTLSDIGNSVLFNVITYFIYPTVTIIIAIFISKFLINYVPSVHNVLTGSRGTKTKYKSVTE